MIAGLYDCFKHWSENGTVWIYSDTHFSDKELAAGVASRPSDEEQVKMINSKVGRKDTLIHLGDVGNLDYVKKLKGYKILICGNHDAGRTNYERQIITQMFSTELYTKEQVLDLMKTMYPNCRYSVEADESIITADGFMFWKASADNMLFDEVYEGPLMIGEKLILSHEPLGCTWAYNIHGHMHQGAKKGTYSFNCCAEAINYTPVNFNQWMKQGYLAHIESIHRQTVNTATKRKKKRGGKKLGE